MSVNPHFQKRWGKKKWVCPAVSDGRPSDLEESHLPQGKPRHRFSQLPHQRGRGQGDADDLKQTGSEQSQGIQRDRRLQWRVHRCVQTNISAERDGQPLRCVPGGRQTLELRLALPPPGLPPTAAAVPRVTGVTHLTVPSFVHFVNLARMILWQ